MSHGRWLIGMIAVALVAAALVLTGCSGSSNDSAANSETTVEESPAAAPSQSAQRGALSECLREQGIEIPEGERPMPGQVPSGIDQDAFREALQECGGQRPGGKRGFGFGQGGFGQGGFGAGAEGLQQFFDCLREQGIDVPEGGVQPGQGFSQLDRSSPEAQEAFAVCRSELGQPGG